MSKSTLTRHFGGEHQVWRLKQQNTLVTQTLHQRLKKHLNWITPWTKNHIITTQTVHVKAGAISWSLYEWWRSGWSDRDHQQAVRGWKQRAELPGNGLRFLSSLLLAHVPNWTSFSFLRINVCQRPFDKSQQPLWFPSSLPDFIRFPLSGLLLPLLSSVIIVPTVLSVHDWPFRSHLYGIKVWSEPG